MVDLTLIKDHKLLVYGYYMDLERVRKDFGRAPDSFDVGFVRGTLWHLYQHNAPDHLDNYAGLEYNHSPSPSTPYVLCLILTFRMTQVEYDEMMARVDSIEWADEANGYLYQRQSRIDVRSVSGKYIETEAYVLNESRVAELMSQHVISSKKEIASKAVSWAITLMDIGAM